MLGFRKKCAYCKVRIDKGQEVVKKIKYPSYGGTRPRLFPRVFCSQKHAVSYQKDIQNKRQHSSGHGGCCG